MEGRGLAASVLLGCVSVYVSTKGSISQSFLPCGPLHAPLAGKTTGMAHVNWITEAKSSAVKHGKKGECVPHVRG